MTTLTKPTRPRYVHETPIFEALDERLCMAVVVWDGGPTGNGVNWHDAVNWAGDVLPGAADDAQLGATGASPVIALSTTVGINSVTSTRSLTLSGTLTLAAASSFAAGTTFTESSGTLGGAGDLTINGGASWTGGEMTGTGRTVVGAAATLAINGTTKFLSRTVEVDGTASWTAGSIFFSDGAIQNDGSFTVSAAVTANFNGGTDAFTNNGTFTKSGAVTSFFNAGVAFFNTGTLNVNAGTLELNGGGTSPGNASIAATAILSLSGAHSVSGAVTAAGALRIANGTTTFSATLTGAGALQVTGGTIVLNSAVNFAGMLELSSGSLDGTADAMFQGASSWTGGEMTGTGRTVVGAAATLAINGTTKFLSRTVEVDGTASWTAGSIFFSDGAIQNDGSFTVSAAVTANFNGGTDAFTNNGTFTKSGAVTSFFNAGVAFFNTGTLNVNAGTLELNGGGTSPGNASIAATAILSLSGAHSVSGAVTAAGALRIANGTTTFSATLTGAGALQVTGGTIVLNSAVNFAGMLELSSGSLDGTADAMFQGASSWTGGTMEGSGRTVIAATGTLAMSGTTKFLSRTLEIDGAATWTVGNIFFSDGAIQNDGPFAVSAAVTGAFSGGTNSFINNGTFTKSGATITSLTSIPFSNFGTLNLVQGTLGTGNFVNDSALVLGAETLLTINGTFTQTAAGSITTEFAGPTPAQYGRIVAAGVATIDGTLAATLVGGYSPVLFDRFDVVTGSSLVGQFASVKLPAESAATRKWITVYHDDRVELVYTSIADWNNDGLVNSTDVGEFINDWFEDQVFGTLITDFDGNGISNSTDVGEFINLWFADMS